jgi:FAD/FMN-containing dehydrogenase
MIDRRPALIARPSGVADVVAAIRFARDTELPVSVRGGGHNVAGTAVLDDGVVIDLSLMKGIRVDPLRRTVRAQGGVTWGELDRETQLLGMAVAGGIVSDTGIAGLTLSGGLGWHRRKHGMSIDNLASADVVTADGRLLVASEAQNPDLFWAIRGGGGNFGVVTSFEYHMNRLGPEVAFALVFYPIEELGRVVTGWREFVAAAPDEITSDLLVWTVPPAPGFPEELHGRPFVGIAALYAGAADHGMRMLRPLRVLTTPLLDLTGTLPYTDVQTLFDGFFPAGTERRYWKSLYLRGIPGDAIREIEQRMARAPSPRTLLSIRHLGGEIARVPADATAFGDRGAPFLLSVDSTWLDAHDDDENIAWTRSFWFAMRRWSNGQVYFNFPGLLEENDLLVSASYGDNFERLRILKTKYDPTNFFRMNQNIRPI